MKIKPLDAVRRLKIFIKQTSLFFLLFFGSATAVFVSWYLGQSIQEFTQHKDQGNKLLQIHEHQLSTEYESVIADLTILSSLPTIDFSQHPGNGQISELKEIYSTFAKARDRYNQIRYLDNQGNERIRINFEKDQVYIVPEEELQHKSHRYYIQDILKLKQDEIYVSPFDLNIENREIEKPYRPMIRLGKRLYQNGKPVGMLIINYEGKFLFHAIGEEHSIMTVPSQLMMLNQDGYWLKDNNPEREWGFMFEDKKHLTFAQLHPDVWAYMQQHPSGQYKNRNGLYSFMKVNPLHPITGIHSNFIEQKSFITKKGHENATWILVSFLPTVEFNRHTINTIKQNLIYIILTLFATFIAAVLVSRYQIERHTLLLRNEYLANHDALTGLFNRSQLDYTVPKKLMQSRKADDCCTLYYLDLDGFKPVNDTYGHDIGDEVLKVVAKRLLSATRSQNDLVIRLGGDELLIVASGLNSEEEQIQFGNKLLKLFESPIVVKQHHLNIGATIGAATYPQDSEKLDHLISMADSALYYAKQHDKGTLKLFSPDKRTF
ncbi:GGDEF domain-containing protein [Thiomicrorhabdus xiamenensis]|uniref:GGDEF domain-containing protein n=1 Tax=Thiomicrorhabdus xiamenensis TaxID=2739063 RepID=A0A7D4TDZ9_9GAMM|nr:GGDEF domain-containing protein [Thiomicrorhabdus xiamenensis]QKI89007.1 GGDEF domain-containing protein [Thiomicrorhabdus xiamenensis]